MIHAQLLFQVSDRPHAPVPLQPLHFHAPSIEQLHELVKRSVEDVFDRFEAQVIVIDRKKKRKEAESDRRDL